MSVLLPAYNVENYLPRCIESVMNQTYRNLKIIIADDCSPDKLKNIQESIQELKSFISLRILSCLE